MEIMGHDAESRLLTSSPYLGTFCLLTLDRNLLLKYSCYSRIYLVDYFTPLHMIANTGQDHEYKGLLNIVSNMGS